MRSISRHQCSAKMGSWHTSATGIIIGCKCFKFVSKSAVGRGMKPLAWGRSLTKIRFYAPTPATERLIVACRKYWVARSSVEDICYTIVFKGAPYSSGNFFLGLFTMVVLTQKDNFWGGKNEITNKPDGFPTYLCRYSTNIMSTPMAFQRSAAGIQRTLFVNHK